LGFEEGQDINGSRKMEISNNEFINNSAVNNSTGIYIKNVAVMTIENNRFENNEA